MRAVCVPGRADYTLRSGTVLAAYRPGKHPRLPMLMNHLRIVFALLFACAALSMSLATSLPAAEEAEGTREYVVKDTDTLSSIALRELGDPRRVNEIMALNPEITDPNRIYEQQLKGCWHILINCNRMPE